MKKLILLYLFCLCVGFSSLSEAGKALTIIPTTKQAVIFTFGGLQNAQTVADVLQRMDEEKLRGTFFVTERELRENQGTIRLIKNHGQEIGIGLRPGDAPTRDAVKGQLERIRTRLQKEYGVTPTVVRQMYGPSSAIVEDVAREMNLTLVGQTRNVVLTRLKDAMSTDEIMNAVFKKWDFSLGRGQILYFRLDFLSDPTLIGKVMTRIHKEKGRRQYIPNLPGTNRKQIPGTIRPTKSFPSAMFSAIRQSAGPILFLRSGFPRPSSREPLLTLWTSIIFPRSFLSHYIGAPQVDDKDRMYGLDQDVIRKADKSGVIKTAPERTIFLTFDDWGRTIPSISCFMSFANIRCRPPFSSLRYMPSNPNLLRAIAEEGHTIGSHTDLHAAMAFRDKRGKIVESQDPAAYAENVAEAYRKLAETVGDVKVGGRYSLFRSFFRPPTLAISENGAKALFNTGYTYLVSGYESTEDYAAHSLSQLVGAIKAGNLYASAKGPQGFHHHHAHERYSPFHSAGAGYRPHPE